MFAVTLLISSVYILNFDGTKQLQLLRPFHYE